MKNSKILNIRSVVKDKVPSSDQLELGQIAINANSENPFMSTLTDTGEVVKFPSEKAIDATVKESVGGVISSYLGDYVTTEALESKGYLTEHQQLKTINGNSIIGDGNITIEAGGEAYDDTELRNLISGKADKEHTHTVSQLTDYVAVTKTSQLTNDSDFVTKSISDETYQAKGDYVTTEALESKGYLTEHQQLKTINGNSIIGDGNITIEAGGEAYDDTELRNLISGKADKEHTHTVSQLTDYVAVTKTSQLTNDSDFVTKSTSDETYQAKGDYALKSDIPTVPTKVSELENDSKYINTWEGTKAEYDALTAKSETTLYIITDEDAGSMVDLTGYLKTEDAASTYQPLTGMTDYIKSTGVKTINGNSIIGDGNITIEAGGEAYDDTELRNLISGKADKEHTHTVSQLTDYVAVTKTSQLTNDSDFVTKSTSDETYQAKGDYALKSDIPTVPTKVSELENDSKYINTWEGTKAEYDALTAKSDTTLYIITDEDAGSMVDLTGYLKTEDAASTYQPLTGMTDYIKSTGVKTINGNSIIGDGNITIEAGGEAYDDTELRNLISKKATKWSGTQAEYDALGTYDADTIYIITDADASSLVDLTNYVKNTDTVEMTVTLSDGTTKTYILYGKEK